MKIGDTFYLRGPENPRPHLWIVLSDPGIDPDRVLIVNLTSDSATTDRTCILNDGDHPCISHPTCVNYPKARILTDEQLEKARSIGALDLQEALSAAVLMRIQQSAADSEDMLNSHRQILIDQNLCDV